MNNRAFLTWIHDRMVYQHNEDANADYMKRLKMMAEHMPDKPRRSCVCGVTEVGSWCNTCQFQKECDLFQTENKSHS